MKITKENLVKRIKNSIFLSGKDVEYFISCLENAPEKEYKKISIILDEFEENQKKVIENINKNNPNFNKELKTDLLKIYNENIDNSLFKKK